jgi:hypothetical protein
MFKLEVFGKPQLTLIDTNQHETFTTALPLLIATYVVLEHQGEAKRERVYEIFFPMKPISPEGFSECSKMIYEKL